MLNILFPFMWSSMMYLCLYIIWPTYRVYIKLKVMCKKLYRKITHTKTKSEIFEELLRKKIEEQNNLSINNDKQQVNNNDKQQVDNNDKQQVDNNDKQQVDNNDKQQVNNNDNINNIVINEVKQTYKYGVEDSSSDEEYDWQEHYKYMKDLCI